MQDDRKYRGTQPVQYFEEGRAVLDKTNNHLQKTSRDLYWNDDSDRGFSLLGLVESMFSVVANGFSTVMSSLVGTDKKNSKPRIRRINYRNYQLIRMFPSTENHVLDLRDLGDTEPDDIKFWSFPTANKFVFAIFKRYVL